MNKKFLKHYMETEPEGTSKKYIFLVDNQDIAMNIVMSGYQALYLGQEDDGYYFSVNSFIEDMRSIQFHGTCQSAYHYVAACTTKWMNDRILEFCKEAGLDGKAGWQLFKEKEYLRKLDNQPEVGKALEQFILRFEREPKNDPELSRFHKFDSKGKITGVRDREKVLEGGANIRKYLNSSIADKVEQQMFWEYFGYCMTTDTQFQKFLMLKGNGGTGKSVAVALIQHVIGNENTSSISLQDLNKRFYATGMYGKLLNACADIPCKAMDTTDVLKKAVGEDTLLYEKKGKDAVFYKAYAKLLFSTNEMPQNLEDKSDAFYRRLLVLDMNQMIPRDEKDIRLKEKIKAEADYAIHMAVTALKDVYERGELIESEHSKECVRELRRLSDSVCAFLEDKLVKEKGKRLKRSDVFRMYEEYCEDNGRQGHAKSGFFKNMEGKGFQARKYNGDYCYQDIAIREEDFQPLEAGEKTPFDEHSEQLKLNI